MRSRAVLAATLGGLLSMVMVASALADEASVNADIDSVLGPHALFERSVKVLQRAVKLGHRRDVAALVHYPITISINGGKRTVRSADAFVARYTEIMTPDIVKAVVGQSYGTLFVNQQGIMFGDGQVWMNGICIDVKCRIIVPKIITIQHVGNE